MRNKEGSSIFEFFFLKRVFSKLLVLLIITGGALSYMSIRKESLPDLEIPQALVMTVWPGASPALVEKEISDEIEKKLKTLPNIKRYRSGSLDSLSVISVEFQVDAPMKESLSGLRDKVSEAIPYLPSKAKKPFVEALSVTDIPVATYVLYGDLQDEALVKSAKELKERIEKRSGVKKVEISGAGRELISIELSQEQLNSLHIPTTLIRQRLAQADSDLSWGKADGGGANIALYLNGKFNSIEDIEDLPIVRFQGERVVRLGEIATVKRVMEKKKTEASFSAEGGSYKACVAISIYKSPGRGTLEIGNIIREEIESTRQRRDWPGAIRMEPVHDEPRIVNQRLSSMFDNAWQAMLIVFAVLMVLLTWREALVAGLSVPLTFLAAIAVLHLFGHTLNELVIIGLVLSLGLLVDDFILIMEGMHDGIFIKGMPFREAARYTVRVYALPSFAGSATTVLVFVPLLFIGGVDGKFIEIIPITMAVCLTISYLMSLLVDIPLSYYLLRKRNGVLSRTKVDGLTQKAEGLLKGWLKKNSVRSKKSAAIWSAGAVGLFLLSLTLISVLPATMYPPTDSRKLGITLELPGGSDLSKSRKVADLVGEVLRRKPYFDNVTKYVGRRSPFAEESISDWLTPSASPNISGFSCELKPRSDREASSYELIPLLRNELEKALSRFPGTKLLVSTAGENSSSEDPVQVEIVGDDMDELGRIAAQVKAELSKVNGVTDIRDLTGHTQTNVRMVPNREALDFHGLSQDDFALQVRTHVEHDEVATYTPKGKSKELPVVLGVGPLNEDNENKPSTWMESLAGVEVFGPRGNRVSAASLIDARNEDVPFSITHTGGRRTVTVMARTTGINATDLLDELEPVLESLQKTWPKGYEYRIGGEAEAMEETSGSSVRVLAVAMLAVFCVLALLFGSFRQPFIIIFAVPFAFIGTFGGFFLAGMPLSFPAVIGMISLVGIVVNDSVVMVDKMNDHLKAGKSLKDAAARGAADRLRPIVSTTVTTTAGLIPLAMSSDQWAPLCLAIIFGLVASTVISLAVVPAMYLLLGAPRTVPVAS